MKMKNRLFKTAISVLFVLTLAFSALSLAACKMGGDEETPVGEGYTVTFVSNGGTEYAPVTTENALQPVRLPTPVNYGYEFTGWYDNSALTGDKLGETYLPTADVTLYAAWQATTYTVKFVSNGGTEYEDVISDGKAVVLPSPEKEHATFAGWYDNRALTGDKLGETYLPTANATLYAAWTEDSCYVVSFDSNGGTRHDALKDYGDGVELPEAFKYGYEFLGWYDNYYLEGDKLEGTFVATENVTLYAKYRKVTYLYLYYGDTGEYDRLSFAEPTVVDLSEYAPEYVVIEGYECPFVGWEYDDMMGIYTPVPATISVGDSDIYLVATFDTSVLPAKNNYIVEENGAIRTTGNCISLFIEESGATGVYSLDYAVRKGRSGAASAAFRMTHSGNDYAYEDVGTWYIVSGISTGDGSLYSCRVTNGSWSSISSIAISSAPKAWQDKWNSARDGDLIPVNITVYDYGTYFVTYVDGDYGYTVDISSFAASFTGTGLGMRSSTTGATFYAWSYAPFKTVTLETNGGDAIAPVSYGTGKLHVDIPVKDNCVFAGWYYDAGLTSPVDINAPVIESDITIYAAWRDAKYNVTLVKNGEVYRVIGYEDGAINLPALEMEANRIYTGWYYDEAFVEPVDVSAPNITSNTTLYAGYRYPVSSNLSGADGVYTVGSGSNVAGMVAETDAPYNRYDLTITFTKGQSGSPGIAFRMNLVGDNSYETTAQYLTVDIGPSTGQLQIAMINGLNGKNFTHFSNTPIALSKLPSAWQTYFNSAASGATLQCKITVIDNGTSFEAYLNDELCYSTSQNLANYTGVGYGIRSSSKNVSFVLEHTPIYDIVYASDDGEEHVRHAIGDDITLTATNSGVLTENDGAVAYRKVFKGWSYTENGELVTKIADKRPLYAVYDRIDMLTVTYDGDNGSAPYYQYYNAGEQLALPEPPFKQGYSDGGSTYGYAFIGWYLGSDEIDDGYVVNSSFTLVATYDLNVAHEITFVTNVDGYTIDSAIVAEGEMLSLPEVGLSGYTFVGWFTDPAMQTAYTPAAVNSSFTLYAKLVEQVTVTFMNGEEVVSLVKVDLGSTATLPASQTKADYTKDNGNVLSYTFAGWQLEDETAVTAATTFAEDTTVYAYYTSTEKRRGAFVTYDDNGGEIYTWTGTPSGGFVLPDVEQPSGEISFALDTHFASKTTEVRLLLFVNNEGQLATASSGSTDGHIFLDYYLSSGRINFGGRITGTSGQPWGVAPADIADCAYKTYVTSLAVGDPLHVDFKVQYGIKEDNSGWIKAYLNGDLMIVYGLTQEELLGESVYGKICTVSNGTSGTARDKCIAWLSNVQYTKVGFNAWQNMGNAGGSMTVSDIEIKSVYNVTAMNGEEQAAKTVWSSGKLYLPTLTSTEKTFTGWYYDDGCTEPVDMDAPVFTADTTVYAGWKAPAYIITLIKDGDEYLQFGYDEGAMTLPSLPAEVNKVHTGWYYDQACTSPVDASAPVITGNTALYAGWRLPISSNTTYADGVYSVGTGSSVSTVIGESPYAYTKHEMNITFNKGAGGGGGIAFRMKIVGDNSYEATSQYLTADIVPASGNLQVARINGLNGSNFAHLAGGPVSLANLPESWQDKFNGTESGAPITLKMTVLDYGTYFEVYLDDALAYTSSDNLSAFDGTGYGIRTSSKPLTFTYSIEELIITSEYVVTLVKDGEEYASVGYEEGGTLSLPSLPAEVNKVFTGWYYDQACTSPVDASAPVITGNTALYAGWRLPISSNTTYADGVYSVGTGSSVSTVIGESPYAYTKHEMNITFNKGAGGGGGIAFRMKIVGDNSYEATSQYLTADIVPASGNLQVARINGLNGSNFAHLAGGPVSLANLPESWQDKFNGTESGAPITLKMTVLDYGTYFEVYLDDALAYTSSDDLSAFDGTGYGVRSSIKPITFTYSIEEIIIPEQGQGE